MLNHSSSLWHISTEESDFRAENLQFPYKKKNFFLRNKKTRNNNLSDNVSQTVENTHLSR